MTQEEEQPGTTFEMFQSCVKGCRHGKSSCLGVSSKQFGPSSLQLCCLHVSGAQQEALMRV